MAGTFAEEYDNLVGRVSALYDVAQDMGAEGQMPQTRNTWNLGGYMQTINALKPPVYNTLSGDLELGQVPLSVDLSYNSGAFYNDQAVYVAPENGLITFVMLGYGVGNGAVGRIKVQHQGSNEILTVGESGVKNDQEGVVQALVRKGDTIYFQGDNTNHDHTAAGLKIQSLSASFFRL